jgi:hypothetical protein
VPHSAKQVRRRQRFGGVVGAGAHWERTIVPANLREAILGKKFLRNRLPQICGSEFGVGVSEKRKDNFFFT